MLTLEEKFRCIRHPETCRDAKLKAALLEAQPLAKKKGNEAKKASR